MKFTDGYWLVKKGIQAFHPAQVYEIETSPDAFTVHATTKRIMTRGDMLDGPMLSIRFSSPMENVIRVQMVHFQGVKPRPPEFILHESPHSQPLILSDDQSAALISGLLSVRVQRGDQWLVEYKAGERPLTFSGWRGMGIVDTPGGRLIHEQLNLGVGDTLTTPRTEG